MNITILNHPNRILFDATNNQDEKLLKLLKDRCKENNIQIGSLTVNNKVQSVCFGIKQKFPKN